MEKIDVNYILGSYCKIKDKAKPIVYARCLDCDAEIDVPYDIERGEILGCPGCGLELELKEVGNGYFGLQELTIEGEDWGE
jgi:hypothetical protein